MMTEYLYVIAAHRGAVKIGVTSNLQNRIRLLQNGNHNRLHLVARISFDNREDAEALETAMHNWYSRTRTHGEWFEETVDNVVSDIRMLTKLAKATGVVEFDTEGLEPAPLSSPSLGGDKPLSTVFKHLSFIRQRTEDLVSYVTSIRELCQTVIQQGRTVTEDDVNSLDEINRTFSTDRVFVIDDME
jgi:predicted GIY-YIG superfamily endonuclease